MCKELGLVDRIPRLVRFYLVGLTILILLFLHAMLLLGWLALQQMQKETPCL